MVERDRVGVFEPAGTGGRVAGVADRDHSLQLLHDRRGEDLGHEAHVSVYADADAIADGDARRLLAPVLESKEAEIGQVGDVDAVAMDTEDAAHRPARW